MKIESWPIEKVVPYDKNPRRNAGAVKAVAESIRQFGFRQPLVVDRKGVLIIGHTRRLAAIKLGMKAVPIHVADLTADKARALRLADNRSAEIAGWDFDLLATEMKDIALTDIEMTDFGFRESEIKELLGYDAEQSAKDNAMPEDVKTRAKVGDLWELGEHRLYVGDSSIASHWEKLLTGPLDMVFTDPPYGVNYEGKTKDKLKIQNDQENDLAAVVFPALEIVLRQTKNGGCWYVCTPSGPISIQFMSFLNEREVLRQQLQWNKDSIVMGRSDYHYQHEPILYGWKPGAAHHEPAARDQSSVWSIPRPKVSKQHPTMKPVELVEKAIINSSEKGWTVGDPFCGSGTTVIACEKTGRRARVMEIDPKYADVILQRWEDHTGMAATKVKHK